MPHMLFALDFIAREVRCEEQASVLSLKAPIPPRFPYKLTYTTTLSFPFSKIQSASNSGRGKGWGLYLLQLFPLCAVREKDRGKRRIFAFEKQVWERRELLLLMLPSL